jgi:hypothetical protein
MARIAGLEKKEVRWNRLFNVESDNVYQGRVS